MGRGVGDIGKERLIGSFLSVISDKRRCLITDRIGQKKAFGDFVVRNMIVIAGQCIRLPIVGSSRDNPEIAIKTALTGANCVSVRPDRYVGRYATFRSCRSDTP